MARAIWLEAIRRIAARAAGRARIPARRWRPWPQAASGCAPAHSARPLILSRQCSIGEAAAEVGVNMHWTSHWRRPNGHSCAQRRAQKLGSIMAAPRVG